MHSNVTELAVDDRASPDFFPALYGDNNLLFEMRLSPEATSRYERMIETRFPTKDVKWLLGIITYGATCYLNARYMKEYGIHGVVKYGSFEEISLYKGVYKFFLNVSEELLRKKTVVEIRFDLLFGITHIMEEYNISKLSRDLESLSPCFEKMEADALFRRREEPSIE